MGFVRPRPVLVDGALSDAECFVLLCRAAISRAVTEPPFIGLKRPRPASVDLLDKAEEEQGKEEAERFVSVEEEGKEGMEGRAASRRIILLCLLLCVYGWSMVIQEKRML